MDGAYSYKAFISYRHNPFDKKMAERLQRRLENYKPPKGVASKVKWKVFRDETELSSGSNLSGKIKEALESSEYLIVVCSETLKESEWCLEEIHHFKELHNGSTDKIIPFIVSGDPDEVFPEEILTTAVLNPETGEFEQCAVEPLAANIAAASEGESMKRFKTEFYRVAAPMLSCSFDSLYHRERKRKRRKRRAVAAAVLSAVLLFSIYSTAMLMKISSQNKDLELKNSALTAKTDELNLSNNNLNSANRKLDKANSDLVTANSELDSSNLRLVAANTELDKTNSKLTAANIELDETNSKLTAANTELDKSNSELAKTNSDLDKTNKELELKTEEALDNLDEATRQKKIAEENLAEAEEQRERAEENWAEAEEQRRRAEENWAEAEEQRRRAEENWAEAEEQRERAEENLKLYQQKNEELIHSNAELTASNADKMFSNEHDRLGAVDALFSTQLYKDDPYSLKPSARLFLNDALYSYSDDRTLRLQHTLDAESYINDFCFSPDAKYIAAYDSLNYVYVFEVRTGKTVYQEKFEYPCGVRLTDNGTLCVADAGGVYSVSFEDEKTLWSLTAAQLSSDGSGIVQNAAFSDDGQRLAVWDNDGHFAFVETDSGTVYSTLKTGNAIQGYTGGNTSDFSDGVHLLAADFRGDTERFVTVNSQTKTYKTRNVNNNKILACSQAGNAGTVFVEYVQQETGRFFNYTVLETNNPDGTRGKTIPLCYLLLNKADIKEVFTTENGETVAAVTGIQLSDEQAALYLVNVTTGDVKRFTVSSPVSQAAYAGSGYLSVFTSCGAEYSYRLSDDFCKLVSMLSDSEDNHADGSQKLIRPNENTAAALGERSTRIMIYLNGYGDGSTVISNGGGYFTQLLETNSFIAAESQNELLVYDKTDKSLKHRIPKTFTVSQMKAYNGDMAVILDSETNILHTVDLMTGDSFPFDLRGFSKQKNWNIHTSADSSRMVLVNNDVLLIFDGYEYEDCYLTQPIFTNQLYGLTALSPDGKKLAAVAPEGEFDVTYMIIDLDSKTVSPLFTAGDLEINLGRSRIAFGADSKQLAVADGSSVYLFDADTAELIKKADLDSAVHSLILGEDMLLVMTEDFVLGKYSLPSLEPIGSLRLPAAVNSGDSTAKNLLLNPQRGELIVYTADFACFVDLETLEVTARTNDSHIQIMGFSTAMQELAVQKTFGTIELRFYPNYTVRELADKSLSLLEKQ